MAVNTRLFLIPDIDPAGVDRAATQMDFDLVIFDCDGVLVDSEPLVNRVCVEMLRELGFALDADELLHELSGAATPARIAAFASRFGWRPGDDFEEEFHARLAERVRAELRPVAGVEQLLARLVAPCCVASNGTHQEIRTRLEAAGLLSAFEGVIFSAADVARAKPAPDVYLHAAARMGVAVERCVVVEDSVPGVRAAVAAGMTVFGHAAITDAGALEREGATSFAEMAALLAVFGEPQWGLCGAP